MTQLAFSESKKVTNLAISSAFKVLSPGVFFELVTFSPLVWPLYMGQWIRKEAPRLERGEGWKEVDSTNMEVNARKRVVR